MLPNCSVIHFSETIVWKEIKSLSYSAVKTDSFTSRAILRESVTGWGANVSRYRKMKWHRCNTDCLYTVMEQFFSKATCTQNYYTVHS